MRYDKRPGHVRVGRLLVTWNARIMPGAPFLDGCWTYLRHDDKEAERFGGVAIRKPWKRREHMGYSICWKGAPMAILGIKSRILHARWVLAGRPAPQPLVGDGVIDNAKAAQAAYDQAGRSAPRPGGLR